MIQKHLIIKHFSRSAGEYEKIARIQRYVANELALKIPPSVYRGILDVGCGTGFLPHLLSERFPGAIITGIDIAPEMVAVAEKFKSHKDLIFKMADGEQLPFSDASFDLVVSSSSFQWMDINRAFSEARRALTPGGTFCFACFGSHTLQEVREVFGRSSTHALPAIEIVRDTLLGWQFEGVEAISLLKKESHPSVLDLIRSLKALGVQNATSRDLGLGGRRAFCEAVVDYRARYVDPSGVYATYEVIFGFGRKKTG